MAGTGGGRGGRKHTRDGIDAERKDPPVPQSRPATQQQHGTSKGANNQHAMPTNPKHPLLERQPTNQRRNLPTLATALRGLKSSIPDMRYYECVGIYVLLHKHTTTHEDVGQWGRRPKQ